jgi:hypothetical protein
MNSPASIEAGRSNEIGEEINLEGERVAKKLVERKIQTLFECH